MECNFSSGPFYLVSSGLWSGVSLNLLLEQAKLKSSAKSITFRAIDGYWVGPFSLNDVMQKTDVIRDFGFVPKAFQSAPNITTGYSPSRPQANRRSELLTVRIGVFP